MFSGAASQFRLQVPQEGPITMKQGATSRFATLQKGSCADPFSNLPCFTTIGPEPGRMPTATLT